MAKFGFSPAEVDVNATVSRDPVPPGEYTLKALEAEEKETASGGTYIKVKFEVVAGEYAGRWIWNNYNIVNASEKAQQIGRQQLVSWATAAGKPEADDTDKLLERPFKALVGIEKGTGGYADRNNIKSYLMGDAAPAKSAPTAPAKAAAKPSAPAKGGNPWD
jgi:hypothetical protein